MRESIRGVLLSGLVCPGLGQLILRRVFSGVLFILLTTAGFSVFIYRMIQRAVRVIDEILPLLANNEPDVNTLNELLSRDSAGGWGAETISLIGVAGCWRAAIVHAYLAGKKIDLND
ncbi:MAG: hypothetical protein PVG69_03935 [Desulfobacterales bacterium]|jgi:hypothetical protein